MSENKMVQDAVENQKDQLKDLVSAVLTGFLQPYIVRMIKLIPFDGRDDLPDSFYESYEKVMEIRESKVYPLLDDKFKRNIYLLKLRNVDFYVQILVILQDLCNELEDFYYMYEEDCCRCFVEDIQASIKKEIKGFDRIRSKIDSLKLSKSEFRTLEEYMLLGTYIQTGLDHFCDRITDIINSYDSEETIRNVFFHIQKFVVKHDILVDCSEYNIAGQNDELKIDPLFGRRLNEEIKGQEARFYIRHKIKDVANEVACGEYTKWLFGNEIYNYFGDDIYYDVSPEKKENMFQHAIAVLVVSEAFTWGGIRTLNNIWAKKYYLVFTETKLVFVKKVSALVCSVFEEIEYSRPDDWSVENYDEICILGNTYKFSGVSVLSLADLLDTINICDEVLREKYDLM